MREKNAGRTVGTGSAYSVFGASLLGGLALILLLFWLAATLAPTALHSPLVALDRSIALWFREQGTELLDHAALEVTFLGSRLVGGIIILTVSPFLWMMGRRFAVLFLWACFLGSNALGSVLKWMFGRPRPDMEHWRVPYATDWSFPSGHAISAIVVYGALFWVIHLLQPRPPLERAALLLAVLIVLLVGISRVYLGVHYPIDVIAGFFAGAGWLAVCAFALQVAEERRGGGIPKG